MTQYFNSIAKSTFKLKIKSPENKQYSLNPNDASDANGDCNGDGYTNIEKYINGINPNTKTDWRNLNNNYDTLAAKGKLM